MSVNTYTPDSTKIIHNTSVDFVARYINEPVHLVQFDNSTPIIAVKLYSNGTPYVIPEGMNVNVRIKKPDRTIVYNPVLGCDETRTTIYFEVTQQTCAIYGDIYPVVEITDGTVVAASGYFYAEIDVNPVTDDDIESSSEAKAIQEYVDLAESWAVGGTGIREDEDTNNSKYWSGISANYEAEAATQANDAKLAAEMAKISETNAENSAIAAEGFATDSQTYAGQSAQSATDSADSATQSSQSAGDSADSAKESESWAVGGTGAREDEDTDNSKYYASKAETSATDAKTSEDNASDYATEAESWAHGGTGTRTGEDSDNAKYWSEQAKAIVGIGIATVDKAGIVKPDGTSIEIDPDGTIHAVGGGTVDVLTNDEIDAIFNSVWGN